MASIWDIPGINTPATPAQPQPANYWPQGVNDLFYNGGNYGQSQDWYGTPVGQTIREQNLNLAYGAYGNQQGIQQNSNAFNQWFYRQFPRFQQSYGLATMNNPLLSVDQFMGSLPQYNQLQQEYMAQSPAARQAQYNAYSPAARWIPR
jgi:hypothetical protein